MVKLAGPGKITAGIRSGNIGSLNAYQKAGFKVTDELQDKILLEYDPAHSQPNLTSRRALNG
jgi:RimJ/RimL family protein N-acetyltransferase